MKFVKCQRRDGSEVFINFSKITTIRQRQDEKGGVHTVLVADDSREEIILCEGETPEVILARANARIDDK